MNIGFDIGGSSLKIGLIDNNQLIYKNSIKYNQENLELSSILIKELFDNLKSEIKIDNNFTIGVGFPAAVDENGYVVKSPNLNSWDNINVEDYFSKLLDQKVFVDNDANIAALAEMYDGNAIDFENFIYITLGTGIGGAIIINRKVFRGFAGSAGEIGHTITNYDLDHVSSFQEGVIESRIGKKAFLNFANKFFNENNQICKFVEIKEIFDLYNSNKFADICIEYYTKNLAYLIASLANSFGINNFIIGGAVSASYGIMNEKLQNYVNQRVIPSLCNKMNIRASKYIQDSGIIGAAYFGKFSQIEYNNGN